MNSIRPKRVSDLVKQEVARMLQMGEIRDPRLGFVTVTDVETSKDLSFCRIFFSTYDTDPNHIKKTTSILNDAKGYFRKQIGKNLSLRIVPELTFKHDSSAQYGDKMDALIKEISVPKPPISDRVETVANFIKENDDYLLVCHVDPDGDAIGSVMAMGLALQKLGKTVDIFCESRIPETFDFLKNDRIKFVSSEQLKPHYNVLMILDLNDIARCGKTIQQKQDLYLKTIIIDHHITGTNTPYNIAYIQTSYAATGLLVYDILEELKIEIDQLMAECLYVAIITDTGGFRYESTSAKVFRVAAELLDRGLNPWYVSQQLYESHSIRRMKLLGGALQSLDFNEDIGYASISLSQELFNDCQVSVDEGELYDGFVNFPRSIKGVEIAIQFKEVSDERTKISFRSRGGKDVAALASKFGGGGHKNASGCTLDLPLTEAKEKIFEVLEEVFKDEKRIIID